MMMMIIIIIIVMMKKGKLAFFPSGTFPAFTDDALNRTHTEAGVKNVYRITIPEHSIH